MIRAMGSQRFRITSRGQLKHGLWVADVERLAADMTVPIPEDLKITATALRLRRDRPELFTGYTPLTAEGIAAEHVLAFDRGGVVTVVTRLPVGLAAQGGWGDTTISVSNISTTMLCRAALYLTGANPLQKTVRRVEATHALDKLEALTGRQYR